MTLLSLCQNAASEIGLDKPSFIINNSDATAQQLLSLARRSVREIGKIGWPQFSTEYTFPTFIVASQACTTTLGSAVVTNIPSTTGMVAGFVISGANAPYGTRIKSVDGGTQITLDRICTATGTTTLIAEQDAYSVPADFLGMVDQSQWDRSNKWAMQGPLECQEWQSLRSGISPSGIQTRFRVWKGKIYIDPAPSSVVTLSFEYISSYFISTAGGVSQADFVADTDYCLIDEDLIELDTIWRFKRMKGLDYQEEYNTAQKAIDRDRGRLISGRILNLSSRKGSYPFIGYNNIPDNGYGV
jgi:hypothetical protein